MLDGWLDDLPERLLTHYVGAAWRAPLGGQMCPVPGRGGVVLGQVVRATPADFARAQALMLRPGADIRHRMAALLQDAAPRLVQDLAARMIDPPDLQSLTALAVQYSATGALPFAAGDGTLSTILQPPVQNALLGVALARLAEQAGLPAGGLALLHAPLPDYINRAP